MKIFVETPRLILREILAIDADGMFELDSNPEVHRYLGNNPVTEKDTCLKVIQMIRQQYLDKGIGRWAVIEKSTGDFIGWSGLKLEHDIDQTPSNYYDLGYRLIQRFWGKGYATESAKGALEYGFMVMNLKEIIGVVNIENLDSKKILEKCGLQFFNHSSWNEIPCYRYKITKDDWLKQNTSMNETHP